MPLRAADQEKIKGILQEVHLEGAKSPIEALRTRLRTEFGRIQVNLIDEDRSIRLSDGAGSSFILPLHDLPLLGKLSEKLRTLEEAIQENRDTVEVITNHPGFHPPSLEISNAMRLFQNVRGGDPRVRSMLLDLENADDEGAGYELAEAFCQWAEGRGLMGAALWNRYAQRKGTRKKYTVVDFAKEVLAG